MQDDRPQCRKWELQSPTPKSIYERRREMKITKMDRKIVEQISKELAVAASHIAEKYGLKVVRKSGSFDDLHYTNKVEFTITETAEGKSANQVDFEKYCSWYSLKPTDFGRELILEGERFTICGLRTKATKNVICIKRVDDGKTFVTSEGTVRRVLGIPDSDPFGIKAEAAESQKGVK